MGPALFTSWLFLPAWMGLLLKILGYKASVHLVSRWLFGLIALEFSFNSSLGLLPSFPSKIVIS